MDVSFATFFDPPEITFHETRVYYPDTLRKQEFQSIVDAITVLKNAALRSGAAGDAEFSKLVAAYPKPQVPEEVRRYKIEAEGAINAKDFSAAADYYDKGLALAPWWPAGHYNRAVVLAEMGEYETAMAEMRHYLLLEPDAADARASQDLIYEWQRKLDTQTPAAPASSPSRAKPAY